MRDDNPDIEAYARCLIPPTALPLTDPERDKWIVTFKKTGGIFCFAGLSEQASGGSPDAYAAVTVPAYAGLKFLKRRHIAIVPKDRWAEWLAGAPALSILTPLPRRSLKLVPE